MSGLRVVCPGTTRRFCFDPFTNIDKVSRILSPTLIIHGTDDEIIGIDHGKELYSRLTYPLEPAWIEGAGHNDIELFSEYASRLDRFFNEDIVDLQCESSLNMITSVGEPVHTQESPLVCQQTSFLSQSSMRLSTKLKENMISSSQSPTYSNTAEVFDGTVDTVTSSVSADSTSTVTNVFKFEPLADDNVEASGGDNKHGTNGIKSNTISSLTTSSDNVSSTPSGIPSTSSTAQLFN
ncbi:unnamed protein product [Heterobilharzia americana]|nr:unnamed protein product [Heterobilharzia americana]